MTIPQNTRTPLLLAIGLALLVSSGFFIAPLAAEDIPYKATTVDECIQEKACVWYHLLLATQMAPDQQRITPLLSVKKWEKPVRIRIIGRSPGVTKKQIDEVTAVANSYMQQLNPYLLQDISVDQKYNFLILVTDDIEREISGDDLGKMFRKTYGGDLALHAYRDANESNKQCYIAHMRDLSGKGGIYAFFTFIQKDNPKIEECIREAMYSGFGPADISYSPLLEKYQDSDSYSKLELLILFLLYQDNIQSGMNLDEMKKEFLKMYEPIMKYINKEAIFKTSR